MILEAIDGDYVVIGLAQIERIGIAAPRLFVRRLFIEPGNAVVKAIAGGKTMTGKKTPAKKNAGAKRPLDDYLEGGDEPVSAVDTDTGPPTNVAKTSGRRYEYADCGLICDGVRKTFGPITTDALKPFTIRLLIHLISATGCDFTRGLPYFNANVVVTNKKLIWPGLCAAASVDTATGIVSLCPRGVAENVVGKWYKEVSFAKQCSAGSMKNADFETLSAFLSTSDTVTKFRRDRVISPGDLCCLVKSGNWVQNYWSDPEKCPCSVIGGGDYGFKQDKPNGKVTFDDQKPLPNKQTHSVAKSMGNVIKWG